MKPIECLHNPALAPMTKPSPSAKPSFPSPAWAHASCPPPRPCPRRCFRSWTSRSSSMRSKKRREAGIEQFVFVTGRGKHVIDDHFDHAYELESLLESARQDRGAEQPAGKPAHNRIGELHAPAEAAGPGPCGVVRAPFRRQRALRGAAARRSDGRQAGRAVADDEGLQRGRRRRHRRGRRKAARRDQALWRDRSRRDQGQCHRSERRGGEARSREGAVHVSASSAATSCSRRSSPISTGRRTAPATRSSSPTRWRS